MREIALHLLDIAENSVAAQSRNIIISVLEDLVNDRLFASIQDDGRGMDSEMVSRVIDPFITSRTTRKVGLGIPLLKAAAEACNGSLTIESEVGRGTRLEVVFQRSHIDRMPLGDLPGTILTLVVAYPEIHWIFDYSIRRAGEETEDTFHFDDQPLKAELHGVSLCDPGILAFFREYIESGVAELKNMIGETDFIHLTI